jgi:hypothetical protein
MKITLSSVVVGALGLAMIAAVLVVYSESESGAALRYSFTRSSSKSDISTRPQYYKTSVGKFMYCREAVEHYFLEHADAYGSGFRVPFTSHVNVELMASPLPHADVAVYAFADDFKNLWHLLSQTMTAIFSAIEGRGRAVVYLQSDATPRFTYIMDRLREVNYCFLISIFFKFIRFYWV